MSTDPRETVKDLIELACDATGENDKERNSAAMKAVKMIRKYDLLDSPLDRIADNEYVQAARAIFGAFNDPNVKKVRDRVIGKATAGRRRSR